MSKYTVERHFYGYLVYKVEANSPEEARELTIEETYDPDLYLNSTIISLDGVVVDEFDGEDWVKVK